MSEEKKREDVVCDQTGTPTAAQPEQYHETKLSAPHPVLNSKSGEGHGGNKEEYTGGNRSWQKWNTTEKFNFWLMVFTGIYAVTTILQWCAIGESNRINREALTSVQRAYVSFKTIESLGVRDAQGKVTSWRFFPQWENSGTTPTKIMRQHASTQWSLEPLPNNFDFHDAGLSDDRAVLIASKAMISTGPLIISPDVLAEVRDKTRRLYFWGWAAYRDVFENSKPHLTEFCNELTITDGDMVTGEGIKFLYVLCNGHNCADEDCANYSGTERRLAGPSS